MDGSTTIKTQQLGRGVRGGSMSFSYKTIRGGNRLLSFFKLGIRKTSWV